MSNRIPCPHPEKCGVSSHIAGSTSWRLCMAVSSSATRASTAIGSMPPPAQTRVQGRLKDYNGEQLLDVLKRDAIPEVWTSVRDMMKNETGSWRADEGDEGTYNFEARANVNEYVPVISMYTQNERTGGAPDWEVHERNLASAMVYLSGVRKDDEPSSTS